MIREQLPQATILTFWHIPWPNPESFGICPWRREILQGMLGSTILGFHTRFHCKNFIETVDRYLEARIEHEHSTISYQEKDTLIESYPISIAWPTDVEMPPVAQCRRNVIERLGLAEDSCLAVGIDRFDYTKGILERLNAVERMLEKWPDWIGRFVFIQVAAPTRGALDEYRSFQERVQRTTDRINTRFGRPGYQPVHLLAHHHEHDAVTELLRAADVCVVTPRPIAPLRPTVRRWDAGRDCRAPGRHRGAPPIGRTAPARPGPGTSRAWARPVARSEREVKPSFTLQAAEERVRTGQRLVDAWE
jgi:trehalose 6-phosphate synthase